MLINFSKIVATKAMSGLAEVRTHDKYLEVAKPGDKIISCDLDEDQRMILLHFFFAQTKSFNRDDNPQWDNRFLLDPDFLYRFNPTFSVVKDLIGENETKTLIVENILEEDFYA